MSMKMIKRIAKWLDRTGVRLEPIDPVESITDRGKIKKKYLPQHQPSPRKWGLILRAPNTNAGYFARRPLHILWRPLLRVLVNHDEENFLHAIIAANKPRYTKGASS